MSKNIQNLYILYKNYSRKIDETLLQKVVISNRLNTI